ncbi:hydroxyethylthiazole kinase [Brockia lithotrophica]|uniref:Hydroxyethylthiazole kinase n=1 Tax=Brockia lithotrophica TaxID=933949 RepID=A0A660L1F2_9BACL|nr:hydroxyethylthiazole kinase [Brockia lithotrophica]RKQ84677.1 hydroxyethylthiazole kinase [Brockia lithotrophica]
MEETRAGGSPSPASPEAHTLLAAAANLLAAVRARRPLVHAMTNDVVKGRTADGLLALGASPIMAEAPEEVEEVATKADALLLNLGTLSSELGASMLRAGRAARAAQRPVVLDPVGAGFTELRNRTAAELVRELRPDVVRGNAAEIAFLAGLSLPQKGVDAGEAPREVVAQAALTLARETGGVVLATGAWDVLADAVGRTAYVGGGDVLLTRFTGSGCLLGAVVAAFAAVGEDAFVAAFAAALTTKVAGELARIRLGAGERPATFATYFLDALAEVEGADLLRFGKVELSAREA